MSVGDIHWVELPNVGGREQAGRRPAIILQDDTYAGSLPTAIVVPLSSAMAALRFPGTARVKATLASGPQYYPQVIVNFTLLFTS